MAKRIIGIVLSALVLLVFCVSEPPSGLAIAGWRAIGVLLFALILWMLEALPITVTGMLVVALVPMLGIMTYADTWAKAMNQAFFFILGSFGIVTALKTIPLPERIMRFLFRRLGNKPDQIVLGFVVLSASMSLFVSDSGAVLLVLGFALSFLSLAGLQGEKNSRLAKCIMLGIPAGAMAGGIATPISNSVNILALSILESNAGVSISFFEWMMIGVPLALIMTPLSAWALVKVFKPEPVSIDCWENFMATLDKLGKWTPKETKFVVVLSCMIGCWIASSWISMLNIASVAIIGIAVMVLPGVNLFTGRQYMEMIQPDPLILIPSTSILAACIAQSGAGAWIVQVVFAGAETWSVVAVLLVIAVVACIAHIAIPIGPAVIGLTMTTMLAVSTSVGVSPVVVTLILSIWAGATYTIPLDGLYVLTLPYEYYDTKDLARYGVIPTAAWLVLCVSLVPLLAAAAG